MENLNARTYYLDKNLINGIEEYDLGSFDPKDFDFGDDIYVMVTENDLCRPELISYKCYGTGDYWWFLMWYNGISDIWNDLAFGIVLKIPQLNKVREFLRLKQNGQL